MKTNQRISFFLCLFSFITIGLGAQNPINYSVDLDRIGHHEIIITIEFPALPRQPLTLRMPASSPGRYAVHHFAKNVYDEKAWDGAGNTLNVFRTDISEWQIAGHDGTVTFQYTLFANHGDGTYSGVDNRKLHLNMPATFIYGVDMEDRPVELSFDLTNYPDWSIATQLEPMADNRLMAPNYYYFFDSPTMVGEIDRRSWEVSSNGKTYTIEIAMMHEGTDEELDDYTEWVKAVVDAQGRLFGGFPDFDFGRYTFLMSYNPYIYGDGMEHRNSTICSASASLAQAAKYLIGTVSHEFIHAWNVERIRPRSLEKFDFDQANMSGELWFGEGFTSYYDDLILRRANIRTTEEYLDGLSGMFNYVYLYPGRKHRNPIAMSYHAPFVDAASSIDEHNTNNTFISYYSYGAVLGFVLDLQLRSQFDGINLDDYMQYMWQQYGLTETPYEIEDLESALAAVTNDATFANTFFDHYIYGRDLPELAGLLEPFGIDVVLQNPNQPWTSSVKFVEEEQGLQVESTIRQGQPLYEAGLNKGDIILQLNGESVESAEAFTASLSVGETYTLTYLQNGVEMTGSLKTVQHPVIKFTLMENPSEAQKARLESWMRGEE